MSREARLRLAMAGLHPDRARALTARYGSPAAAVTAIRRGSVDVPTRARQAVERSATETLEVLRSLGVGVLWNGSPGYPAPLAGLPDAPDLLFARGHVPDEAAVAIVGTRSCTGYGRRLARSYGRSVAEAGWVVVSGLARGIDAEAHLGTLDGGGSGVAVLGSGSNVVYPAEHRDLHDRLLHGGGAVLTEYPPGTPPEGWRFPPRNRIIAGLAGAVVVVEAGVKGGALITAAAALDHGRTVLAVPGDVDREASRGCNLLIRDGAVPVLDPEDLVEALSLLFGPPKASSGDGCREQGGEAELVLGAIRAGGVSLEDLAEVTGLPVATVLAAVGRLEAAGQVERVGGALMVRAGPGAEATGSGSAELDR